MLSQGIKSTSGAAHIPNTSDLTAPPICGLLSPIVLLQIWLDCTSFTLLFATVVLPYYVYQQGETFCFACHFAPTLTHEVSGLIMSDLSFDAFGVQPTIASFTLSEAVTQDAAFHFSDGNVNVLVC